MFLIPFVLSVSLNLFFWRTIKEGDRVAEVVDGDTFQLKSGKRVRLIGADAPELERCGGKEAREKLESLILDKIVTLKEETSEAYGRTLALVFVGRTFVNKIMLEEGWGRTDYRKNSRREELTAAFHQAQSEKKGIFSDLCRDEFKTPEEEAIKAGFKKAAGCP